MGFFDKINEGLHRSRTRLKEQMNILLDRGPDVDDDFWDDLEETLILADIGAAAADNIIEELRCLCGVRYAYRSDGGDVYRSGN